MREVLLIHHLLLDRLTSPRNSVDYSHEAVPDQQIAENVGEYLFGSDRTGAIIYNGIEGETHEYNGTDYTYTGLSDVTVTEGEDETVYNFKLREGVTFSDGEPLTADDLIFTLLCTILIQIMMEMQHSTPPISKV